MKYHCIIKINLQRSLKTFLVKSKHEHKGRECTIQNFNVNNVSDRRLICNRFSQKKLIKIINQSNF